jgi:hypothetical protein
MNAHAPPPGKGEGALASTPKAIRLLRQYLLSLSLQLGDRRCVVCGTLVGNWNLGGHDGHSALSGPVFCLLCADGILERREE